MIHIYHGEGKGKTSAAVGLALRALGAGWKVCVVQFLKGTVSGEIEILRTLPGVTVLRDHNLGKFSFQMTEEERAAARRAHDANLQQALELARQGDVQLLVLDEIFAALSTGLIDAGLVRRTADLAAEQGTPELVLTGRNPPEFLLEQADYITEMKCQRHPYQKGVAARKGVEF